MALALLGFVELPAHAGPGGFDHAAVHTASGLAYVAHTANDALDVVDLVARRHVGSITGLTAVAGALVGEAPDVVVTSNRGEDTLGIFAPGPSPIVEKIAVGARPNGLAYDSRRRRVLSAHVGDAAVPGSCTVSVVDVARRRRVADVAVAGRTRWAVFDPPADLFHVNVADPPQIVAVGAGDPVGIRRIVTVPHAGPHGLAIDAARRRLFCACDAGVVVVLDADTGSSLATAAIPGVPDAVFFDAALHRLYVAIGQPGVIAVFDTTEGLRLHETVRTEPGAHTFAFDAGRHLVCPLLPVTHRMAIYTEIP